MRALEWRSLGEIHLSNCHSNERASLFIARNLIPVPQRPEPTEVLELRRVTLREAAGMVEAGEIKDSLSIIAILKAARELGQ